MSSAAEVTAAAFADLMAELPAGVALITTKGPDGPMGLAVTSMTAYTADPPSIMTSVALTSRSHDLLINASHFGAHVLHHAQEPIARVFASKADDKFSQIEWSWDGDVPRVHGALAYMRCARDAVFTHRDHSVLIGVIERVERDRDSETGDDTIDPMLYVRRKFSWRFH